MTEARRIGRYEIGELIGKGVAASVYRGTDAGKPVALKIANRAAVSPERLAALRESTQAIARLRHPAVVPVIELVEHDKAICIVSEVAPGESLAAILKSGEYPDLRRTWDIARQLLQALEAVHGHGILHGDLKPTNIFIGREGLVTLTDFGLANLVPDTGTLEYMAPEQVSGGALDARTDVYQAGALIYLLATTRAPFSGTREEIAHRVLQERPADPSSMVKKLAWQLDWVIQRALSKDPADRMGGAREFMDGLRLALQESIGSPIPVPKPGAVAQIAPAPAAVPAEKPQAAPKPEAAPKPAPAPKPESVPAAKPEAPRAPPKPIAEAALAEKAKIIASKPAAAPKPQPAPPPKPRVLFVDDDERVLNALRALFREKFDVATADSGAAALEHLKANPAQIVVSDQRMPGMTGVELLREVKKAMPRTVRILLTGYSDLAALVGSINEGEVFRFVKKPWDNDDIHEVMKEAAGVAMKLGATAKPPPARAAGAILVIDTDPTLAQGLRWLLGTEGVVHEASTVADAAKVLQSNDVAAVVGDLRVGSGGLVSLFKLLKAKRPDTLSILLSDQADSEMVADLINQAHIHRYFTKPVDGRELHEEVLQALKRYASRLAEGVAPLSNGLVADTA